MSCRCVGALCLLSCGCCRRKLECKATNKKKVALHSNFLHVLASTFTIQEKRRQALKRQQHSSNACSTTLALHLGCCHRHTRLPSPSILLQRVVDEYQPRRELHPVEELVPESSQAFANADNLDSSIAYLSSSLSGELQIPLRNTIKNYPWPTRGPA